MHLLGLIEIQDQNPGIAVSLISKAVSITTDNAEAYNNLGIAFMDCGKPEQAINSYQQAIAIKPNHAWAQNNHGIALKKMGMLDLAIVKYKDAIASDPKYSEAYNNLANALHDQGKLSAAIANYNVALKITPNHTKAHFNLAIALEASGQQVEAIASYRTAISINPNYVDAIINLSAALQDRGEFNEAVTSCQSAINIDPDNAKAHYNLAMALEGIGNLDEAAASYQKTISIKPRYAKAHYNLGIVYNNWGLLDQAISSHRKAIEIKPNYIKAMYNLLFAMHHTPDITPQDMSDELSRLNEMLRVPGKPKVLVQKSSTDKRPLKVGLVGKGRIMRRHPSMWLSLPVLEAFDPQDIELIAYVDGPVRDDDFTHRLKRTCRDWRAIGDLNDADAAELMRGDGVDILISMSSHTETRMSVFAHRPAPVQVLWGGHWGTSGLEFMDWIIADDVEVPNGEDHLYTENVYRMPHGYVIYEPPQNAPAVGALPALKNGFVTFGSFNRLAKINVELIALWAQVLEAVPDSVLLLKGEGFACKKAVARVQYQFADHAIASERLLFEGRSPHHDLLDSYNRMDIALDTNPYSGGLTTCEALWMGVPVLTMPSPTFSGRHSASHLTNVGLSDWVVETPDAYVETALRWAGKLDELAALRTGLRDQVKTSPLCDAQCFAHHMKDALQYMLKSN
ncbi:MAG: tetratricopeptide repeat protein [Magnetovibrio sp.]|nr:tetratricopeptide repeat protein [Magnetovibrio sp.]